MEAGTTTPPKAPEASEEPEREIDLNEAGVDQAPAREEKAVPAEDVVDILRPKKAAKEWTVGTGEDERKLIQKPLSFIAKMQWFSLVGEVLDEAMGGENALSMNSLLSAPTNRGALSMADFRDADTFVHAIGKLLVYAPDFLLKSYCIWLAVPDYQRDYVAGLMSATPDEGGLTDEDGIEIIEVFIDQNYEALDRFFRERLGGLQKRVQARMEEARPSRPSRR